MVQVACHSSLFAIFVTSLTLVLCSRRRDHHRDSTRSFLFSFSFSFDFGTLVACPTPSYSYLPDFKPTSSAHSTRPAIKNQSTIKF
ncbi:hypothetical protein HOY80DRAFT_957130 [Tuber brumale]|nr:hypothetical protein HOY80DRAFT_957130 [Tuber brumale]